MYTKINEKASLVPGGQYRASYFLKLADTESNKNKVLNVIRNADKFVHSLPHWAQLGYDKITITKVEIGVASDNNLSGRVSVWPVRISFKVKKLDGTFIKGGTESSNPIALLLAPEVLGLLAALIAIAVVGFVVVARVLEQLLNNSPLGDIFKPEFAILALVGLYVFMKYKRG